MGPIEGVLDEKFFLSASEKCLDALARLIDDAIASRFQAYINAPEADQQVVSIIKEHFEQVLKTATFHFTLLERGSPAIVAKIELEAVAEMRTDQQALIEELEFLEENYQYIRAYIKPREKRDYERFTASLPRGYISRVEANKVMFYQPRAKQRPTGVGIIIRKHDIWELALKGLKFRRYFLQAGYMEGYMMREF